jgi:hypothetical protein
MKHDDVNRTCKYCEKPLRGRIDKKFCDDLCRNYYHNRFKMYDQRRVREVNAILYRNLKILRSL